MAEQTELVPILHANGNSPITEEFFEVHGIPSSSVSAEEILGETEPVGNDLVAVLWKLKVVEVYDFVPGIFQVLASDVDYKDPKGIHRSKPDRLAGHFDNQENHQQNLSEIKEEIASSFKTKDGEQITVEWLVAFALQFVWFDGDGHRSTSKPRVARVRIKASFNDPPTPDYIRDNFDPTKNPGFKLAELATPDRAVVEITNNIDGSSADSIQWEPLSYKLMLPMIVNKVIPPHFLNQLTFLEGELVTNPDECYQQIAVSLLGLK